MTASTIAGRYSREVEVGRGGMGAVWRGTDEVLGRPVALKRIGVAPGGATPDVLRAEREARLAARLNDPHVVSVYDLVGADDGQWLVMEYVDGTDLADLIRQRGALAPDELAPILAQTASALAAAHASGIVHRDVKPSNILVTPAGQVKLSDFGIARTQADAALTQTGLVTGSPAYLSPEVASGRLAAPPSDLWSLGATLFHALEGRPPYDLGDNLVGGLYRIVHEPPPRSSRAGWLTPMLAGTMIHDPAERWTAAEAQAFLETGRVPAARPASVPERLVLAPEPPSGPILPLAPDPSIRHRASPGQAWWVIAVAAVVVVALAGWAVAVGLGGSQDGGTAGAGGGTSTSTSASSGPSGPTSPSGGTSADPSDGPTADAMTSFLSSYLQTVVSHPGAAFAELTPGYQQRSGGQRGYQRFWGSVSRTKLISAQADPASLVVEYTYRYARAGKRAIEETHRMQLEFTDGRYLIADQS